MYSRHGVITPMQIWPRYAITEREVEVKGQRHRLVHALLNSLETHFSLRILATTPACEGTLKGEARHLP